MIIVTIRIDYSKNCFLKQKDSMNRDRILQKKCPDFVKNILIQSIFELCDIVSFWLLRGKSGLNLKSIVFIVHFS